MTGFSIGTFSVFHNFAFPLDFEVDFSKMDFRKLSTNSEVKTILISSLNASTAILKNNNYLEGSTGYGDCVEEYFSTARRLFSPHYFSAQRNIRLFLVGPKLLDMRGKKRNVDVNALLDKRGILIINFHIAYDTDGISTVELIEELHNPYHNATLYITSEEGKEIAMDLKQAAKYYYEKIASLLDREVVSPKNKALVLSKVELQNYIEPYALTVINMHSGKTEHESLGSQIENEALKILLWDYRRIDEFNTAGIEKFYEEISQKRKQVAFFSAESTLMINNGEKPCIENADVIYTLINIEILLMQKVVLQLYDRVIDKDLNELRQKRVSPNTILSIRNDVLRDLEEFFDVRTKLYQRGREISDVGKKVLNLTEYYNEIHRKIDTLDDLIKLRHTLYLESLTLLLTSVSLIVIITFSVAQFVGSFYQNWVFLAGVLSLTIVFGLFYASVRSMMQHKSD